MNPDHCIHCGATLTLTDGEERVCEKCGRVFLLRDKKLTLLSIPTDVPSPAPDPEPEELPKAKGKKPRTTEVLPA